MIDPDVPPNEMKNLYDGPLEGDLVGAYPVRRRPVELYANNNGSVVAVGRSCVDCKREPAQYTERCMMCQNDYNIREADKVWSDKVVERAERDPVYAARLKMALGL